MTYEPDETLSAEQERRVRAALASARLTSAPPEDVVARLDATLGDLVAERAADRAGQSAGAARASRRHRNRWLLLAAAAGVAAVVALGVPALRPDQARNSTAEGASGVATASPSRSPGQSQTGTAVPTPGLADSQQAPAPARALPRLHSQSFQSDVRQLLGPAGGSGPAFIPETGSPSSAAGRRTASCPVGTPPAGVSRQQQVLLDGHPALLDLFPVRGGSRLVRAVTCDGIETLASTRIPARGQE